LLTVERKIQFFKSITQKCRKENLNGFSAGAFMLGRFLCQMHPLSFWSTFNPAGITFMLNEYILFEKYTQVLYEFGERHLSRTRNRILTEDLKTISLSAMDHEVFIPLKLASPDWEKIESLTQEGCDKDTQILVKVLKQPYGILYNYDLPWSFEKLKTVCAEMKKEIPDQRAI